MAVSQAREELREAVRQYAEAPNEITNQMRVEVACRQLELAVSHAAYELFTARMMARLANA